MYLLPRIVALGKATEMVLTGAVIDADEALRVGVVSRVIEDDALLGETLALARALAAGPIRALALAKHALNDGLTADFARAPIHWTRGRHPVRRAGIRGPTPSQCFKW